MYDITTTTVFIHLQQQKQGLHTQITHAVQDEKCLVNELMQLVIKTFRTFFSLMLNIVIVAAAVVV